VTVKVTWKRKFPNAGELKRRIPCSAIAIYIEPDQIIVEFESAESARNLDLIGAELEKMFGWLEKQ